MSTHSDTVAAATPMLRHGERLDQKTFHERYRHAPPDFKAELIGGVVHVAAALRTPHGEHHFLVVTWLGVYAANTPGVRGRDNTTAILDDDNETQPDAALVVDPECGGRSRVNDEGYAEGPPELIVEVSDSTLRLDLNEKLREYERAGVQEYAVVALPQNKVRWFAQGEAGFEEQSPVDGVHRSSVFPGLWLNASALFALDSSGVLQTLNEGLAEPSHAAFVEQLERARGGSEA